MPMWVQRYEFLFQFPNFFTFIKSLNECKKELSSRKGILNEDLKMLKCKKKV